MGESHRAHRGAWIGFLERGPRHVWTINIPLSCIVHGIRPMTSPMSGTAFSCPNAPLSPHPLYPKTTSTPQSPPSPAASGGHQSQRSVCSDGYRRAAFH